MSYATDLLKEKSNPQFLCIVKPRYRFASTAVTEYDTGIHYLSFSLGQAVAVSVGETLLTEAASAAAVLEDEWYYDVDTGRLYIGTAETTLADVVVTYEIYLGTYDPTWYRVPTDSSTRVVYFEPLITRSPSVVSSTSDVIFGFMPNFSAQLNLSNASNFLNTHLYDSSWNRAELAIYHYFDELSIDGVKLFLKGYCNSIQVSDHNVSIGLLDATSFFDNEFRHSNGKNFYTEAAFPNIDPQYIGRPIRKLYGRLDGVVPVNIDYVQEAATNTDNRVWALMSNESFTIASVASDSDESVGTNTATRTYLEDATGFNVGDSYVNGTLTGDPLSFQRFGIITAVNKTTAPYYIDHSRQEDQITQADYPSDDGDPIVRGFIGYVRILHDNQIYKLNYLKDFTFENDTTNGVIKLIISSNIENRFSWSTPLQASDPIWCRIYGPQNDVTMSGSTFGSNSDETAGLSSAVVILFDMIKRALGDDESQIDLASFTDLLAELDDEIGLAVPATTEENFSTYKEVIIQLCQTLLVKLYLNSDNKWAVARTDLISSTDKTITDSEIQDGKFSYEFIYDDLVSNVIVRYQQREINELGQKNNEAGAFVTDDRSDKDGVICRMLHTTTRQKTFNSLHFHSDKALELANRLLRILADRRGIVRLTAPKRFLDTQLNHNIEVSREDLPGYEVDPGTNRTRDFAVLSVEKSIDDATIELDDQKGMNNYSDEGW